MYGIKERNVTKFTKLTYNSQYIQNIEPTNESIQKGKYFMITIKTGYREIVHEITDMVKYL